MPLPLAAIPIAEFAISLLTRLGVARWVNFAALRVLLTQITIKVSTLRVWIGAELAKRGLFWSGVIAWIASEWDEQYDYVVNLWDRSGGSLKGMALDYVNTGLKAGLQDAVLQKTGVSVTIQGDIVPFGDTSKEQALENLAGFIGEVVAVMINESKGTEFTNVYPPQQFFAEVKTQVIADITNGTRRFLSNQDIVSLKAGINAIKDSELVQQFGVYAGDALDIPAAQVVSVKIARRRAQGRARSREYYRTHKRNNTWIPR